MDYREEMKQLRDFLNQQSYLYYVLDAPVIPDYEYDRLNRRLDVTRAMDRLKPRDRAMLWLAYAQGASHDEIARMVGVRPSSMKALLSRARRKLASALGAAPAGGGSAS